MSGYAPAPHKPDSRVFASYPMPAKIDLINERPRRESIDEKLLENQIGSSKSFVPRIQVDVEVEVNPTQQSTSFYGAHEQPINQQQYQQRQQQQYQYQQEIKNTYNQQQYPTNMSYTNSHVQNQFNQQQQPAHHHQQVERIHQQTSTSVTQLPTQESRSIKTIQNDIVQNKASVLAAELAEKEAKLMADITAFHQRPYSPFQVPAKIDLTNEQRKAQQQFEHAPSPRPLSQASSIRSASGDLMDKEAKLLQEIEAMEKKPYNPQTMVVEREQWFEYPDGRPDNRQLTDSKRRVKDFCSLPSHMYPSQGAHIYEDNLPMTSAGRPSSAASSIHTTIIRSPKREIDNKSPLPFAFDNFSTKGVRGNIASAGAIEPERPRPPIYPIIKRTPSPNMARS